MIEHPRPLHNISEVKYYTKGREMYSLDPDGV